MIAALLLAELVLILIVLAANQESEYSSRFPRGEGNCQGCGYSLAGLPNNALCPECGLNDPGEATAYVKRRVLNPAVLSRIRLVLLLMIFGSGGLMAAISIAYRWSYTLQLGCYKQDVIANAIRIRPFDLPYESSLLPFSAAVFVFTIFASCEKAYPFKRNAWRVIPIAWCLSVVWLFVATYLRFA